MDIWGNWFPQHIQPRCKFSVQRFKDKVIESKSNMSKDATAWKVVTNYCDHIMDLYQLGPSRLAN